VTPPPDALYRTIPLTKGLQAIVDAADYKRLASDKWRAQWNSNTRSFYAFRMRKYPDGKSRSEPMHRVILGLERGDPREGDHALHDTLDNRRFVDGKVNLRIATDQEQQYNKGKYRNNTSGFKGVFWHQKAQKWMAQIRANKEPIYLGLFLTKELAYAAYCEAAIEYHGEFACFEKLTK